MKFKMLRALLVIGLISLCSPLALASQQAGISAQDSNWMKQQQQALQEFKEGLAGQNVNLPSAQQNLVAKLQQGIRNDQVAQGSDEKRTPDAIYFVSLGIPHEGLLPMLQDAARLKIPATLRGLIDNDFRKTAAMMFELTKDDKNIGVQIDPTLYTDYHITAVPALVVTCPGHYDVIRGSLPLHDALQKIAEQGDCAGTARKLLEADR